MCLAQGHNAVMLVRLEPTSPLSRVKRSTTEPLRSHNCHNSKIKHHMLNVRIMTNTVRFHIKALFIQDRRKELPFLALSIDSYILIVFNRARRSTSYFSFLVWRHTKIDKNMFGNMFERFD